MTIFPLAILIGILARKMLNARIFITNKPWDTCWSDYLETAKLGTHALNARTVIINEHDPDARIRNDSQLPLFQLPVVGVQNYGILLTT